VCFDLARDQEKGKDRCTQVGMTVAEKGVAWTPTMISLPLMIFCHTARDQTAVDL
jgi:hypothetical protein